jgi:hypothetical protein
VKPLAETQLSETVSSLLPFAAVVLQTNTLPGLTAVFSRIEFAKATVETKEAKITNVFMFNPVVRGFEFLLDDLEENSTLHRYN